MNDTSKYLTLTITLLGKPIPHKNYAGTGRTSYDPQAAIKDRLRWEIRSQFNGTPIDGIVRVDSTYYFPIPKTKLKRWEQSPMHLWYYGSRPDGDNCNKTYYDCLKSLVFL